MNVREFGVYELAAALEKVGGDLDKAHIVRRVVLHFANDVEIVDTVDVRRVVRQDTDA